MRNTAISVISTALSKNKYFVVFRFGKGVTCIAVHTGHIANVGLSGQNMCSELECTGG